MLGASTGVRVAVLGINFAPERSGIAPYTTRMAAGLSERGHRVEVVTTVPHYPEWRVATGYRGWSNEETLEGLAVRRVKHYVPRRPTTWPRVLSEVSFGARLVSVDWRGADVVICPSPALLSTAMALFRASAQRSRPAFGVVVQDLYSAGLGETGNGGGVAVAALSRLESAILRRADGVSVIHDRLKRRIVGSLDVPAERVEVIRNWTHVPPVEGFDRETFRRGLGWGAETVVLHAGAMGDKQGLENVVHAGRLAQAAGAPVRFVLMGNGGRRADLEVHAQGCSAVEIRDSLPGDEFGRALRSADILLVNERPGVVEMAVPSKLTSYFGAGVAVLAATDEGSTTAQEIADSGAGLRVPPGDPSALMNAVLRLRDDSTLRLKTGARGPEYCERLLSEEQALDAYDAWVRKLYATRHGEMNDQEGTDHGHHRPRRFLSG